MADKDVTLDEETARYKVIRKTVARDRTVKIFFYHLFAYVLGNIFLGAWNIWTFQNRGDEFLWFYFPLIFWGVGVIIHYLQSVALFEEWWDRDEAITDAKRLGWDEWSDEELAEPPENEEQEAEEAVVVAFRDSLEQVLVSQVAPQGTA